MRLVTSAVVGLLLFASPVLAAEPILVSMIQLIAAPEKFDGKHVIVVGVAQIRFEGYRLFLHKEDFEAGLPNALWLRASREELAAWKPFEGKYVSVQGIFSAKDRGHLGVYSGSIKAITRFELLSPGRGSR